MKIEHFRGRELCAEQVGDQVARGSKRPYVASVDGHLILNRAAYCRRFATADAALAAARNEVRAIERGLGGMLAHHATAGRHGAQ